MAGWSLFAFAGAYPWTLLPILAIAVWLAAVVQPAVAARRTRSVDLALCGCLLLVALQLVPLTRGARQLLSPSVERIEQAIYLDRAGAGGPLTLDRAATAESLAVAVAMALIFWSARAIFERGSMRTTLRAVAMFGLIVSAIAVLQHAAAPQRIYGIWKPEAPVAAPYGPFVSRNDLATWLVMAMPLTIGYVLGRVESRRRSRDRPSRSSSLDATTIWLGASVAAMAAALLASLSRSGLIAGAAALASVMLLSRSRMERRQHLALGLGLIVVLVIALAYTNMGAMMVRLNDALAKGVGGRRDIWAWTRTIVGDFWLTGVGVGAYARAMSVYQPPHLFAYNHAHDEYLQVLAEGGVLLAAAVFFTLVAGTSLAIRRLAVDRSPMFWMRAGAVSGLFAVAVQSIWETGLRMPANAVLFAICAAVAVHGGRTEKRSG